MKQKLIKKERNNKMNPKLIPYDQVIFKQDVKQPNDNNSNNDQAWTVYRDNSMFVVQLV